MCNLCSMTTNRAAIAELFRVVFTAMKGDTYRQCAEHCELSRARHWRHG